MMVVGVDLLMLRMAQFILEVFVMFAVILAGGGAVIGARKTMMMAEEHDFLCYLMEHLQQQQLTKIFLWDD